MCEIGDAEEETNCVKNVGLATTVEPGYGIELVIEPIYLSPLAVRLEAVDNHRLDKHGDNSRRQAVWNETILRCMAC